MRTEPGRDIETRAKMASMELHALRSRMNHHFIFNALILLNYFIDRNEKQFVCDYVARFASLMRKTFIHSEKTRFHLEKTEVT